MKHIVYIVLATTLFTLSCKKNKTELKLKIEGVTLDSKAIAYPQVPGVNLLLEEKKLEGGVFNSTFVEVGSFTSDNTGAYHFDFIKRNTVEFRLTASKENFFPYQEALDPSLIKPGITYNKNVNLIPKAWLRTTVINENPVDENDKITVKYLNANFDCDCCSNVPTDYVGMAIDETTTCKIYGNTWIKYLTTVHRYGTPDITVIDSIFCNSFDTTNVVIGY